jgi:hypothetical protein
MRITFAFFGIIAFAAALLLFGTAKSAVHEILGAIMLLIFIVCAATVAILGALLKPRPSSPMADLDHATPLSVLPPPPRKGGNWINIGK